METIKNLLNKIKWDKKENPEDYIIVHYDRIENTNKELRFEDIKEITELGVVVEKEGEEVNIPLHRIREVRKKKEIVWRR